MGDVIQGQRPYRGDQQVVSGSMSHTQVICSPNTRGHHRAAPGGHAVVGSGSSLADLSFADYLMWVRRDRAMVCVAKCQPTPGRRWLHTDAVGTVVAANNYHRWSPRPSRWCPGRERAVGQRNSCQHDGHSVEAPGARRSGGGADTDRPPGAAYRLCATDLLRMLVEHAPTTQGTWRCRDLARAR